LAGKSDCSSMRVGNTCDNSYLLRSGFSVEERVLKLIDESEIELAPYEIARKVHGKRSTVRVILRKLLDRGLILQPYPGAYCNKITYGMRFVPLCVHNISLRFFAGGVSHWEEDEVVGGVKIHVCFGQERRKVSGCISCDAGMSHDACLLALNRWFDIVEGMLGRPVVDLELLTFECNKDYYGVRIDGVQCVTKKDLFGMVERIYQKEENLVRREWKVSQPMSVNAFEAAIKKGVAEHDRVQASFEVKEEVKRLSEAVKFANGKLYELEKLNAAMFGALTKLVDAMAVNQETSKGSEKGGSSYVS
jgi:hypothetical protein